MTALHRIELDKAFYLAEQSQFSIIHHLILKNQEAEPEVFEFMKIVVELIKNNVPIVPSQDRDPLADHLQEFIEFYESISIEDRIWLTPECFFIKFTHDKDFLYATRLAQGLELVSAFAAGGQMYGDIRFDGIYSKTNNKLRFIHKPQFKKRFTQKYFNSRDTYGEAVIPEGEYLELDDSRQKIRITSGNTLRFMATRFYASETAFGYASAIEAKAMSVAGAFPQIEFYLQVVLDPNTINNQNQNPIAFNLPMHWVNKIQTREEHFSKIS